MARKKWVKLWCEETVYGSTSKELRIEEVGVWHYFLALAGMSPIEGIVCVAPGLGYTDRQLAQLMNCSVRLIKRAKRKMVLHQKVEVCIDESIIIRNWMRYQSEYSRTKPYYETTTKHSCESTAISTKLSTTKSTLQNKNKIKKERVKKENPFFKLLEYAERQVIPLFLGIDFAYEFCRYWAYWAEGDKVTKNPALALLNWMTKAEKFRTEREGDDEPQPLR